MKEFFQTLKDIYNTIPERLRTPPIISFIVIWLYMHWHLIFLYFNFDEGLTYEEKHSQLVAYITDHGGKIGMFWKPLFWTLVSVLIYFGVSVIIKGFTIAYTWVLAGLYYITDKRKIRTAEEFKILNDKFHGAQRRIEELLDSNSTLANNVKRAEDHSGELSAKLLQEKNEKAELVNKENEQMEQLKRNNSHKEGQLSELQKLLADQSGQRATLEKKYDIANAEIQSLNAKKDKIVSQLSKYNLLIHQDELLKQSPNTSITTIHEFKKLFFTSSLLLWVQNGIPYEFKLFPAETDSFTITDSKFGVKIIFTEMLRTGNGIQTILKFWKDLNRHETFTFVLHYFDGGFVGMSPSGPMVFKPKPSQDLREYTI